MITTDKQKEKIYLEYQDKVRGYIFSRINNRQEAEDIAEDVFVKIFEKADTFDEKKASLSTWIYTITRNTLTDYYRTRKVFCEIPETLEDDSSSVEDEICNSEMLEKLSEALEKLDKRERDIIIMRFYSGKTLKEIAKRLDISYSYAKILQNKALDKLKKSF